MNAKIVAREIIKPSCPTPKSYNLSFIDQEAGPIYVKLYFFYQNSSSDDIEEAIVKRSQCLKSSLSKVLSRFYPFAGKIRDKISVSLEENDGAEFVEARVDSILSDYLEKPNHEMFLHLVPHDFLDMGTRPLLIVQASFFKCGGLAIGMNISHKVSDACTFTSFIKAWADTATGKSDKIANPNFSGSLVFPASKKHFLPSKYKGETVETNNKTRRLLFTEKEISSLQVKATNETINRATRIETITAFIWRIKMKMTIKKSGGSTVPPLLLVPTNIRKRLQAPICDETFGNMVDLAIVSNESGGIELPYLISLIREQIKESHKSYPNTDDFKQYMKRFLWIHEKKTKLISNLDANNALMISSWSKFPFYEADFGWGKPTWVANLCCSPYFLFLMDTRDGKGIEAWVNFPEEDMDVFACDEELLTYAILDPSVL